MTSIGESKSGVKSVQSNRGNYAGEKSYSHGISYIFVEFYIMLLGNVCTQSKCMLTCPCNYIILMYFSEYINKLVEWWGGGLLL